MINIRYSASALGTKNIGQGGGANLLLANVFAPNFGAPVSQRSLDRPAASTADYYHMDGLYDFMPYDLNAMGSWGQAIATTKGYRYVWIIGCDHPAAGSGEDGGWGRDSTSIYAAFSNDPAVFPDPSTMFRIVDGGPDSSTGGMVFPGVGSTGVFSNMFTATLMYNPDDSSHKAYLFVEGEDHAGTGRTNSLNGMLLVGNDFDTEFIPTTLSHPCTGQFGLTGYQRVYRNGVGDFVSWGGGLPNGNDGSVAKWTSTDGQNFTIGSTITKDIGSRSFTNLNEGSPRTTISSQVYAVCREDARSADGGMYVAYAPINATTGTINGTGTPPVVRVSAKYEGVLPTPTYLQTVSGYEEDGVYFAYALHGFFGDANPTLLQGKLYENGGGLNEQYIDIYAFVTDATAAANAAPCGVRVSAASGVASIQWYDIPAGRTYRIYRGTSIGTQATLIGDTMGASITDSPAVGSVYYYKVVALNGGVEQGSRIVSTYVS